MKKLLMTITLFCIPFIFYACQKDNADITSSTPELSSVPSAKLKVRIKSNDGREKTFSLDAIEWNDGMEAEFGKFYKVSTVDRELFKSKIDRKKMNLSGETKLKTGVIAGSIILAGSAHDTAPGLCANSYATGNGSGSFGTCDTHADAFYYGVKTHEHAYTNYADQYYYSQVDSFSVWSEVYTEFNSSATRINSSATCERGSYWYWTPGGLGIVLKLAATENGPELASRSPIPCPPYCYLDSVRVLKPGDLVEASCSGGQ